KQRRGNPSEHCGGVGWLPGRGALRSVPGGRRSAARLRRARTAAAHRARLGGGAARLQRRGALGAGDRRAAAVGRGTHRRRAGARAPRGDRRRAGRTAGAGAAGGRLWRLLAVRAPWPERAAAARVSQPAASSHARHLHAARAHHVCLRRRRAALMEDFVSAPWLRRLFTAVLLGGLVLLGFRVFEPFIVPLVWAGILAFVSWPVYEWLLRACRERRTVAALLVAAALIAPLVWLAVVLRIELVRAYHETQAVLAGGVQLPPAVLKLPWIGDQLRDLSARIVQDPHLPGFELRKIADRSFDQIAHVVGDIGRNVAKMLLAVVCLFFVYRDGKSYAAQLASALEQLLGARVHNYLLAIGQTVKAVVYGLVL